MIGKFRVAKAKHLQQRAKPTQQGNRNTAHKFIVQINLVRPLASLVFGKQHHTGHRMLAGLAVAAMGVFIVKTLHVPNEYGEMAVDFAGYGLHGLGLTPFAEYLSETFAREA